MLFQTSLRSIHHDFGPNQPWSFFRPPRQEMSSRRRVRQADHWFFKRIPADVGSVFRKKSAVHNRNMPTEHLNLTSPSYKFHESSPGAAETPGACTPYAFWPRPAASKNDFSDGEGPASPLPSQAANRAGIGEKWPVQSAWTDRSGRGRSPQPHNGYIYNPPPKNQ